MTPSLRRTVWGQVLLRRSWGLTACSTIPSPLASSPEFYPFRWQNQLDRSSPLWDWSSHLCKSPLALWCSLASGSIWNSWSTMVDYFNYWPWHKNSLHLALFPGLKIALLRGDILHELPSLVSANLHKHMVSIMSRPSLVSANLGRRQLHKQLIERSYS